MGLKLDTILAFVLIIPYILSVGLAPRSTPLWFFTIIFVAMLLYVFLDVSIIKKNLYERYKNILLWFLLLSIIISSFASTIILRHETFPTFQAHDIVIQQEEAMKLLLAGKNPYQENYFGTPLEQWHYSDTEKNPALYHFVMQPFYVLFAIPFYALSGRVLGYFDGRFPLLFLFLSALIFAFLLLKDGEKRRSFLLILAFNPLMVKYTLEGRSDFFMYGFLFAGLYFLYKGKFYLSAIITALAFAVKQSAWPLLPFYAAYLLYQVKDKRKLFKILGLFTLVFLVIVLPFFLWSPKAFLDSTIFYLSGNTNHSYPISGYGFGALLSQWGIIKNVHDNFPFTIFQVLVGAPLLIYLIRYFKKNLSVRTMILAYAIFLFIFWYFSRYFNNSHIAYLSVVLTTAYFWPKKHNR